METGWYTSDQKRILDNTYIHLFKIKKSTNRLFDVSVAHAEGKIRFRKVDTFYDFDIT